MLLNLQLQFLKRRFPLGPGLVQSTSTQFADTVFEAAHWHESWEKTKRIPKSLPQSQSVFDTLLTVDNLSK